MNKLDPQDLFAKYSAGLCTEEEKAIVESWYLKELRDNADMRPDADQLSAIGTEIWGRLRPRRQIMPILLRVSAAAAVFIALLFVYRFSVSIPDSNRSPEHESTDIQKEARPTVLMASRVENRMMKLPDGTLVILEKGSKLTLFGSFNGKHNREVELEGKAFFDVAHNPLKPFIIYTGSVRTTVLGTSFDITAMPGSNRVKVNVIRGLVEVKDTRSGWVTNLPKNFQAVFDNNEKSPSRRHIDAAQELSWNKEDLEFKDISIAEAKSRLEDKFGYKINVDDTELLKATFSYSMRSKESMESFINGISIFIGASYTIDKKNKTISIQPLNQ